MTSRKSTGIRISARLRGAAVEDDEWQEVPDEWLALSDTHKNYVNDPPSTPLPSGKKRMKTGLESDGSSISELTELSDGGDDAVGLERDVTDKHAVDSTPAEVEGEGQQDQVASSPSPPDDFVEWETVSIALPGVPNQSSSDLPKQICVTLEEWESIGKQFEKATHYAERALHKILSQSIVPVVIAELRVCLIFKLGTAFFISSKEVEKKRYMEEAVVHRKRSSRIAMKEIEKEEQRAAMRKRLEEEEKMSRTRRLEARQQKELAERLKRENARELRRKERELQERQSAETREADSRFDRC